MRMKWLGWLWGLAERRKLYAGGGWGGGGGGGGTQAVGAVQGRAGGRGRWPMRCSVWEESETRKKKG